MAETCRNCGDPIEEPKEPALVAAGGWCGPTDTLYETPRLGEGMCSDCRSRMLFIMEMGFDPGRHGENLKVPRGGIKFADLGAHGG